MFRQGDILIKKIEEFIDTNSFRHKKDNVIAIGKTGNSHKLIGGEVYLDSKKEIFLVLKRKGKIVHKEHKPIVLEKGIYKVIKQKEYISKDEEVLIYD